MAFKVLILGGTGEGRWLAERLAGDARFETLLSFAGRTEALRRPSVAHRVGGFGGVAGLATYLRGFDALVDATHPYAARISTNAVAAAAESSVPLIRWQRAPWPDQESWIDVPDMDAAVRALGTAPRRVFLTIGRQELAPFSAAPQHHYLIRAIDAFACDLPHARVLLARGPFRLEDERDLLQRERIELVVSKNAGTPATYAKIEAARELGVPVVMVARPRLPPALEVASMDDVLQWLDHGASRSLRGA